MAPSLARLAKPDTVREWSLEHSSRQGKKWMVHVTLTDGTRRTVHFGDSNMEDYTQHHDAERRRRFHLRFAKLIAKNAGNPLSPMYYSANLLW